MATKKNKAWLLLLLLIPLAFKKKNGNTVIVDEPLPEPGPGALAIVQIAQGAKLYNMNFIQVGTAGTVQHWEQLPSTTLPTWIKVKNPLGQIFYVKAGDYKILPKR